MKFVHIWSRTEQNVQVQDRCVCVEECAWFGACLIDVGWASIPPAWPNEGLIGLWGLAGSAQLPGRPVLIHSTVH